MGDKLQRHSFKEPNIQTQGHVSKRSYFDILHFLKIVLLVKAHMHFILSISANNVRTASSIGMGKALIDVTNRFDVWVSQFLLLATPNLLHYCSSMSVIQRRSRVRFDGVYEWWGGSCTAHLQLVKARLS